MRTLIDWLNSKSIETGSKIVLAADVSGPYESRVGRAASLVSRLKDRIVAVKVNLHLLLPFGVLGLKELVNVCVDADLPLIADLKLNDIGATNREATETLFSNGFDVLIATPFVGSEAAIGEVINMTKQMHKGLLLLVYMSHRGAKEGYGLKLGGEPLYVRFAKKTRQWGADGAVVSSKSPSIIREVRSILGDQQLIFSPGVGVQGGDARKALAAGSDYVIVGRTIVEAKDPLRTLEELNRDLGPRRT